MQRAWKLLAPCFTAVALLGLVNSGCSDAKSSTEQTNDNASLISSKNKGNQAKTKAAPKSPDRFGLYEDMPYREARSHLINKGWKPNVEGDAPNLNDSSVKELINLGYEEVKDCSGTGVGACRFEFINSAGELLVVSAITKGASNRERVVWRWFREEKTRASQPPKLETSNPKKPPFVGTKYFNFLSGTGTGQAITIQADGTTTIELRGTASTLVEYHGPFSNPIILSDGRGLLLEGDKIYSLLPGGQIAQGCKGEGQPCEAELYDPSTTSTIADGLYVLGGTDQGLEVAGGRYRYYDELGTQAWQPVSQLTYIQPGVIFDGELYWCIPSEYGPGVCTENGWKPYKTDN